MKDIRETSATLEIVKVSNGVLVRLPREQGFTDTTLMYVFDEKQAFLTWIADYFPE